MRTAKGTGHRGSGHRGSGAAAARPARRRLRHRHQHRRRHPSPCCRCRPLQTCAQAAGERQWQRAALRAASQGERAIYGIASATSDTGSACAASHALPARPACGARDASPVGDTRVSGARVRQSSAFCRGGRNALLRALLRVRDALLRVRESAAAGAADARATTTTRGGVASATLCGCARKQRESLNGWSNV